MGWNTVGSLVWMFAFGALFFFVMSKGGCGMHGGTHHRAGGAAPTSGHDARHGHGQEAPTSSSTRDPVCGMEVDAHRAAGFRKLLGQTVYFCSATCLERFDRVMERYAKSVAMDRQSDHADHDTLWHHVA